MIIMKDAWIFLIALICVCHLHNQSFNYFAIYATMQKWRKKTPMWMHAYRVEEPTRHFGNKMFTCTSKHFIFQNAPCHFFTFVVWYQTGIQWAFTKYHKNCFFVKEIYLYFLKFKFLKIKNLSIFMLCNALSHRPYWNEACLVGSESNAALFKYCLRPQALNYTFNPPIFPLHLCRRGGYA